MSGTIAAMHAAADQLAAASIGYSQSDRWTFLDRAKRTVRPVGDGDCSSTCAGIAWLAGYPIDITGTCYTGNLAELLNDAGWKVLRFTTLDAVRPGDILVTPGHHAVYVRSGSLWWSAEANELGTATGGKPGDQTGKETVYRAPYNRPGGWTWVARPPADNSVTDQASATGVRLVLALGAKGDRVQQLQTLLASHYLWAKKALAAAGGIDGVYGKATASVVSQWQQRINDDRGAGLVVDGEWGPASNLAAARYEEWNL